MWRLPRGSLCGPEPKGSSWSGRVGFLTGLTKTVLETALGAELDDHLGYPKHAVKGRDRGNSRNGTRSKTVLTEIGEVELDVPRDRDGSFEPKIVAKRQRRLAGVDELVISLTAKGLTTGEIFIDPTGMQFRLHALRLTRLSFRGAFAAVIERHALALRRAAVHVCQLCGARGRLNLGRSTPAVCVRVHRAARTSFPR